MTDKELNDLIDWCRKKIVQFKKQGYNVKTRDGYENAMLAVMSHLSSLKEEKQ